MAKAKRNRPPTIKPDEAEQISIRRKFDFPLGLDEFGRQRVPKGTQDAQRAYDASNGGIVRIRNVDPLKGISSLTPEQRQAGDKYREIFEFCEREGARAISIQERVDGGKLGFGVPEALSMAHSALSSARRAIGHHEIEGVIDNVCCHGRSLRELASLTGDPREALLWLLKIGLDNLSYHYMIVPRPKQKA
ncbi:DUF6456 domain-containing protein [Mesorhizobium ciceri]|uniref:DUF6456 domain-containing protein n=1 Tax=Mesorhizobium TaxID=68287 RepID=UPI00047E2C98|nr:DUF6456 domain-containing protein [Mesorhizobium ciceri]